MPLGPRQLLENRIAELSGELEVLFDSAREHARREHAEQLNQAARRLRAAPDAEELCATLAEAVSRLTDGAMLFRVEGEEARSARMKVALSEAPALAAAAASDDPVVAVVAASELTEPVVELIGEALNSRVTIFPVAWGGQARALVFCWGSVQLAALELLTQAAAAAWSVLPEPVPELVTIQPAEPVAESKAVAWDDLPADEQKMHLRAQRFARVQAAEMRLYHAEVVQVGRARRNLYEALRQPIDDARAAFRTQYFTACPSMVDYLHLELTRTLANDDPDLLGSTYPGPLL